MKDEISIHYAWNQEIYNFLVPVLNDNIWHVFSQFMVVTLNGPTGLVAASHAQEDLRVALAHAPIPRLKTEEESVANWDELQIWENATITNAQVNEYFIEKTSAVTNT